MIMAAISEEDHKGIPEGFLWPEGDSPMYLVLGMPGPLDPLMGEWRECSGSESDALREKMVLIRSRKGRNRK